MEKDPKLPIVFFDGVCILCNGFVDFALKVDRNQQLRFATLQGENAKIYLANEDVDHSKTLNTVVYLDETGVYTQSDAILKSLTKVGGVFKLSAIFLVIPKPLRDWVYKNIAKRRYQWFGQKEVCRLPTPEEKDRILD